MYISLKHFVVSFLKEIIMSSKTILFFNTGGMRRNKVGVRKKNVLFVEQRRKLMVSGGETET